MGDGDHTALGGIQAEVFPVGGNKSLWGGTDTAVFNGTVVTIAACAAAPNRSGVAAMATPMAVRPARRWVGW